MKKCFCIRKHNVENLYSRLIGLMSYVEELQIEHTLDLT